MGPGTIMLVVKLLDLAIAGGQYATRAIEARNRLQAMLERGGATPEELDQLDRETDTALADLRAQTSGGPT